MARTPDASDASTPSTPDAPRYVHFCAWCVCAPHRLLMERADLPDLMLDAARALAAQILLLHMLDQPSAERAAHQLVTSAVPLDFPPMLDASAQETWPAGVRSPYLDHRAEDAWTTPMRAVRASGPARDALDAAQQRLTEPPVARPTRVLMGVSARPAPRAPRWWTGFWERLTGRRRAGVTPRIPATPTTPTTMSVLPADEWQLRAALEEQTARRLAQLADGPHPNPDDSATWRTWREDTLRTVALIPLTPPPTSDRHQTGA